MLGIIIALTGSLVVSFTVPASTGWSIFWGISFFFVFQIAFGLILRKKMMAISNKIQDVMAEGQKKLSHKANQMQQKPQGNPKVLQKVLEKEQNQFLKQAIEMTSELESFYKWSFMIKKQVSTMRMQLNYQMKNYEEVDRLMPDCFFMDPVSYAMKMARQYKNDSDELEKTFEKAARKFKGAKGILIYALYSWVLVKRKEIDKAIKVLVDGKEKTGSELLTKNWELLANGKVKQFSNAMLGDQWYVLGLEEPKVQRQKVRQRMGRGGRPF